MLTRRFTICIEEIFTMDKKVTFKTPSVTVNGDGDGSSRRVGFELEFSRLTLDEAVNIV
jgi:hypothetical protein